MGELYLACFGIASKTLKNRNLKNTKLAQIAFLAVNFSKNDFFITFF